MIRKLLALLLLIVSMSNRPNNRNHYQISFYIHDYWMLSTFFYSRSTKNDGTRIIGKIKQRSAKTVTFVSKCCVFNCRYIYHIQFAIWLCHWRLSYFPTSISGIHPHDSKSIAEEPSSWFEFESIASQPECVAIGPCGLDYQRDFSGPDIQKSIFEKQLLLADKLCKPVLIHERSAQMDVLDMLEK